MTWSFGPFVFEPSAERLRRDGVAVPLSRKAMTALLLLLERQPDVVTREDLFDALWADVVVVEANLRNVIHELRRALGDHEREGRFLRTVHGRGYAFVGHGAGGKRRRTPARAVLAVAGHEYVLGEGDNLVGRTDDCRVSINDRTVSRTHARIVISNDCVLVEDLASKNGTFVDGVRLRAPTPVRDGAAIAFGSLTGTFTVTPSEETTLTGLRPASLLV